MEREHPVQLDFAGSSGEETETEPSVTEERWRLNKTYEEDAGSATLTKGEAIRKRAKKKAGAANRFMKIRNVISAPKKGDQGELGVGNKKGNF